MAHGEYTHIEIPADDLERARRFYGGVFGWDIGTMGGFGDYLVYRTTGEHPVGGGIGRRNVNVAATIVNYVEVDSIEAALDRVRELGGSASGTRTEVPGMGWWIAVTDSEGNPFALFEPAPR